MEVIDLDDWLIDKSFDKFFIAFNYINKYKLTKNPKKYKSPIHPHLFHPLPKNLKHTPSDYTENLQLSNLPKPYNNIHNISAYHIYILSI